MGVQKYGKTKKTRESQKLIVGPWIHNYGNYGAETVTIKTDFGINSLSNIFHTHSLSGRFKKKYGKDRF